MALAGTRLADDGGGKTGEGLFDRALLVPFAVVCSMFFMWAITNNFNDILIKQFQKALELSRMQSGLVQTAFYFGYFTVALPAGWVMTRLGYRNGLLIGLGLYAAGAFLFWPAAEVRVFGFFLAALYIIAAGLAFLETAANPLITVMGPAGTAAQRLNFAQSFNGFGAFIAPFIGGAMMFSGVEHTPAELAAMTPGQVDAYRATEAHAIQMPYFGLGLLVLLLALVVWLTRFPPMDEETAGDASAAPGIPASSMLRRAVIAQFFYIGAQVVIWSYFINFAQDLVGVGEMRAAHLLGYSLMAFMAGRFTGTALMRFVEPARLLVIFGLIAALLCGVAMAATGWAAVIALGLTSFFMSIMFPTIFALGIAGLGAKTKLGSSLIIMAIIGGAVFPPLVGLIADKAHSLQLGMAVPLASFVVVAAFGLSALGKSETGA
ncbi:MFS transporter, FHS family, L-fucose permease [Novosphingobium sp. CF614]|uniref:L-fucose:H+ symporter permease n=1 Tax=Novosphingobium sp. CF614 TaxID=1884364 RepID=UPI0008E45EC6|nr:L-fucose:H+ symporter permease [Novosphingobium sp. CF614]SFF73023.1 MFS transporter, FHS family, L-fucose permease [Novosphingobium sp. CF614]